MEKFIGSIFITLLIVEYAEPIQFLKRLIGVDANSDPKQMYMKVIRGLLNCALCSGFWVGLIVYQDIYMAAIISFSAELVNKILERVIYK